MVIDSNVYISCLLGSDTASQSLKKAYILFDVACSQQIVDEVCKFIDLNWTKARSLKKLLRALLEERASEFLDIDNTHIPGLRDQADSHVIQLAIKTQSVLIITGDKDLLEFKNPPQLIINASDFLELTD